MTTAPDLARRSPTSPTTPTTDLATRDAAWALEVAEAVVEHGFDARHDDVTSLLVAAASAGVGDVLLGVVADESAPRPVRERALGLVVVRLARPGRRPPGPSRPTAPAPGADGRHAPALVGAA